MERADQNQAHQKHHCPINIVSRQDSGEAWQLNTEVAQLSPKEHIYSLVTEHGLMLEMPLSAQLLERNYSRAHPVKYLSEIITQGRYECVAMSLSMLLGIKPFYAKRALAKYGWRNDDYGATEEHLIYAARDLGTTLLTIPSFLVNETIGPSIVCVKSLNLKGRYHAVCWNGVETLDPNVGNGRRLSYGPEWAPWTIGYSGVSMVVEKEFLSPSLKTEIDNYHRQVELRRKGTPDICRGILKKIGVRVDP